MAVNPEELIRQWWEDFNPDPRFKYEDVETGTRAQTDSERIEITYPDSKSVIIPTKSLQTGACQYWVRGLPAICKEWDPTTSICSYAVTPEDTPTGYGDGLCDMLGRRHWCNRYENSKCCRQRS